jgi:hypothetical protein
MIETSDSELYERIEDLECELSSAVSARDMTIRDLKAELLCERQAREKAESRHENAVAALDEECAHHRATKALLATLQENESRNARAAQENK